MSLQKHSLVGALVVMGMLIQSNGYSAEIQPNSGSLDKPTAFARTAEDLPWIMRQDGIRKPVRLEERTDLQPIMDEARERAAKVDTGCEPKQVSEVHLIQGETEFIAGYEIYAECEDAPSPAVGVYFDVNSRYLGLLDLSN